MDQFSKEQIVAFFADREEQSTLNRAIQTEIALMNIQNLDAERIKELMKEGECMELYFLLALDHYRNTGELLKMDGEAEIVLMAYTRLCKQLIDETVKAIIAKNYDPKHLNFVLEVYEGFKLLNLRNSTLRRSVDDLKWKVNKANDILYDMTLYHKI